MSPTCASSPWAAFSMVLCVLVVLLAMVAWSNYRGLKLSNWRTCGPIAEDVDAGDDMGERLELRESRRKLKACVTMCAQATNQSVDQVNKLLEPHLGTVEGQEPSKLFQK